MRMRKFNQAAVPNISVAIGSTRELTSSEILYTDSIDYLLGGALTLRNGRIDKYLFDEGYCQAKEYVYNPNSDYFTFCYYDKDHLGNIRQVTEDDGSRTGEVIQATEYYPFGAEFCDGHRVSTVQSHKFNGKEFDNMHGLNTYDYGARQYNPVTVRWDRMDPLAEDNCPVTPYSYCNGDPINRIDPNGRKSHNWILRNNSGYDPRDYYIYNNRKIWDDRVINIFAHGLKIPTPSRKPTMKEYMSVALQISDTGSGKPQELFSDKTNDINKFAAKIRACDENFSDHSNGDPIIVLHSCATANFARDVSSSDAFRDVIIIAPNANLHVNGGKKGQESVRNVYLQGTGKTIKGEWQVYKNGAKVLDKNGKPITYPSNAQPGSIGFIYGF